MGYADQQYATMRLVEYRRLAREYRRLAALLTRTDDKAAMELFAAGWDKIADNHEAMRRNRLGRTDLTNRNTSRGFVILFVHVAENDGTS
jgi:D-aminopeptidase